MLKALLSGQLISWASPPMRLCAICSEDAYELGNNIVLDGQGRRLRKQLMVLRTRASVRREKHALRPCWSLEW